MPNFLNPTLGLNRPHNLFNRSNALGYLTDSILKHGSHAFTYGFLGQNIAVGLGHDQLADSRSDFHDLKNSGSAGVTGVLADHATLAFISAEFFLFSEILFQYFFINLQSSVLGYYFPPLNLNLNTLNAGRADFPDKTLVDYRIHG